MVTCRCCCTAWGMLMLLVGAIAHLGTVHVHAHSSKTWCQRCQHEAQALHIRIRGWPAERVWVPCSRMTVMQQRSAELLGISRGSCS